MSDLKKQAAATQRRDERYLRIVQHALTLDSVRAQLAKPSPITLLCLGRSTDWHHAGASIGLASEAEDSLEVIWGRDGTAEVGPVVVDYASQMGYTQRLTCGTCGAEYTLTGERLLKLAILAYDAPMRVGNRYVARLR